MQPILQSHSQSAVAPSFCAALVGKVVKQAKLAILIQSVPLLWEKIGRVAKRVKLAVPIHSAPLQWEKNGKVVKQAKLAVPSHSVPLL